MSLRRHLPRIVMAAAASASIATSQLWWLVEQTAELEPITLTLRRLPVEGDPIVDVTNLGPAPCPRGGVSFPSRSRSGPRAGYAIEELR